MNVNGHAALGYVALAILPIFVQLGLVLGAPWGRLTLGGRWPGRLPPAARLVALLQAGLLSAMALAILQGTGGAGLPWHWPLPGWASAAALVVTGVSLVLNALTPSQPERCLWVPVLTCMLVLGLVARFA